MVLGFLTFFSALTISAVAIYYSVAGLVAIFAAAAIPIIVMGVSLEVGKLVTAVWLHRNWERAAWWLKTYLSIAVLVLMFITSMGIFGFLSKAHIEQTSAGTESIAQVERIENEIKRNEDIIVRAENQIKKLESSGTGSDANIQSQIDKEQERIDNAYKRIQPAIDEQQAIIDSQASLWRSELAKIDAEIETLQGYIDNGETKKAQQMIGASADGIFGKKTADKIGDWQDEKQKERLALIKKIEEATNNPQAKAAAEEIKRLRKTAEDQVKQSNALIDRLRKQLGNTDKADSIDAEIDTQTLRIKNANTEIDTLVEQKYKIEGEYRKLEAEVGPVKYIAEFIYGEKADQTLLEKAVTWVIITIIFVFDPLAVLMLLASQMTYAWYKGQKDEQPTPSKPDPKPSTKYQDVIGKTYEGKGEPEPESQGFNEKDPLNEWNDMIEEAERAVKEEKESKKNSKKKSKKKTKKTVQKRVVEEPVEEFTEDDADDAFYLSSLQEPKQEPDEFDIYLENASNDEKEAMQRWKHETGHTLKIARKLFNQGTLEELPWMKYLHPEPDFVDETKDKQKVTWMEHDKEGHQIKKEGYKQNEEQNDDSIWQQIQKGKE